MRAKGRIIQCSELRDRVAVFQDRQHAGHVLAGMLLEYRSSDAILLAIPSGGVPVAAAIAERLELPLDAAVVSKITLPWNTEAGYGAVAFDGSVRLNDDLVRDLGLSITEVEEGIKRTKEKVRRRMKQLRADAHPPDLSKRSVILVDDGLASGYTLLTAAEAVRATGAKLLVAAVPTGHTSSLPRVSNGVDEIYCANLRGGSRFAVADAYENWRDVDEDVAAQLLKRYRNTVTGSL